jgi:hypothetical protein
MAKMPSILGLACRRCRGRIARPLACLALMAASGLALGATPAGAAVAGCGSDPVLVVNGAAVDVYSTLYTADPSAIQELDYAITVPTGSILGDTTLTTGIGFPEKVTYVFSPAQRWGTLAIAASVVTQPGTLAFPVQVSATTLGAGGRGSGTSAQTLVVQVVPLLTL